MRKTTLNQFAYWIRQQFLLAVLVALFLGSDTLKAQIYQPEGLNMPGAWNGWTNPPTNNLALASFTQVPGGLVTKISSGITRWQTTFNAAATGGNVVGGTYQWLFTSGPSGSPWNNKWSNVNVTMNTLQTYTKQGANNNSITVVNGKWYTMNWKDNGYANTEAIFMETSAAPVTITDVSIPLNVAANEPATVTITTSASPSSEELFYLLYSTNNFTTSFLAPVSMVGSSGTATIPGQLPGAVVKYYVFSTTVASPSSNYDLYSIKINNNSGLYYSFITNGLSSEAEILSFAFAEQTGPASINSPAASVTIEVAYGTNLTALDPTITVSNGASIDPASGVAQDFTNPVSYLVTAQDGITTKLWSVTVTVAGPPVPNYGLQDEGGTLLPTFTYWYTGQAADITEHGSTFNGKNLGELSSLTIKGSSFKTWKTGSGDVTGAQFKYKVWADGESEPIDYTIHNVNWTSDDGDGNQTWANFGEIIQIAQGLLPDSYNLKIYFTITGTGVPGVTTDGPFLGTFSVGAISNEAEILTFTLPEQTGPATINTAAATVTIEVTNGTDLSNLTPTITISESASINPASGFPQDFSNPVIYTVTAEDDETSKLWTVTVSEQAPPSITWANLQWPGSGTIEPNQQFFVYAQAFVNGITQGAGQGVGLQAWIGYSTENTNPNTWTNWIEAPYFGESSSNDEFRLDLGALMGTTGTFYYASRFKLNDQDYVFGGFSGGFWDGTTNVSGVLTVNAPPVPEITWANVQWPGSGTIDPNQEFFVYAQAFANGITPGVGQGTGLQAWIGYSTENTNPNTWTTWFEAPYLGESDNNDEFRLDLGALMNSSGTYYYASRFKLNEQEFVYGGYSGGFWDGITNVSGILTVNSTTKTLNLTVFLEGLYAGLSNMNKAQDELGDHFVGTVADQITVELHNGTDYATIEYSQTNVDLNQDGTASILVPSTFSDSYWLSIKHRNSIETVSAALVDFSSTTITYNFSSAASQAYGDNMQDLGDGIFGLFTGDINHDGSIDNLDLGLLNTEVSIFLKGFVEADLNGDGICDGLDFVLLDNNAATNKEKITP